MGVRPARFLAATVTLTVMLAAGCGRFGLLDRELHSVPSPDGQFVAVCQEVPVIDGPDFDVRLHRADGRFVRKLHYLGDAYRCDEVVWSPDSRTLALLNRSNSQLTLVDVEAALRKPVEERLWHRTVTLTDRGEIPSDVRFVSPNRIAYLSCKSAVGSGVEKCGPVAKDRRLGL